MERNQSKLWEEIHQQPLHVHNTLTINIPTIKAIAQETIDRKLKQVVLVGRGSSEHACQIARYLLESKCGMVVSIAAPSVITLYHGNIDLSEVLCIGVSQSGAARDVYEYMKACEEQGGLCVSITNVRNSLMATVGKYRMNLECGQEESITAAKSYMNQLTLLIALCGYLSNDAQLLDLLYELPSLVESGLNLLPQIETLIPPLRNTSQLLLFGRGYLYGLALECELKIQETCYLDARAYASSDYRHGPIATTQRFVPALFFIADAKTDEGILALHHQLKEEKDIFSIVVSNREDVLKEADLPIRLPEDCTGIRAVFVCAVFSQLLSCLLSLARGYDPDHPDGVSKKTVTI